MRWADIRAAYPDRWLVIEALEAHSTSARRIFDRIAVLEECADGPTTMKRCTALGRQHPERELGFAHTSNVDLEIEDRPGMGRGLRAAGVSR